MFKKVFSSYLFCFFLLAGCAAENQRSGRSVDMSQVNSINKQAEFRNMDIIWVNPPVETVPGKSIKIPFKSTIQSEDGIDAPAGINSDNDPPQHQ